MAAIRPQMLTEDDLIGVDRMILDALAQEGRATPQLLAIEIEQRDGEDYTRQHISQRLKRLVEHDHVENVEGTGVYAVVNDPRE